MKPWNKIKWERIRLKWYEKGLVYILIPFTLFMILFALVLLLLSGKLVLNSDQLVMVVLFSQAIILTVQTIIFNSQKNYAKSEYIPKLVVRTVTEGQPSQTIIGEVPIIVENLGEIAHNIDYKLHILEVTEREDWLRYFKKRKRELVEEIKAPKFSLRRGESKILYSLNEKELDEYETHVVIWYEDIFYKEEYCLFYKLAGERGFRKVK